MNGKTNDIPMTIVIAEDDDGHARLIEEHLKGAGVMNRMLRTSDGRRTLDFFFRRGDGEKAEAGRGYLLLLDIKMPELNGIEVLEALKADEELRRMPVIMLTTTDDPRDVEACYRAGCNSYLTKPVAFAQFAEMVKRLGLFISIVKVAKI